MILLLNSVAISHWFLLSSLLGSPNYKYGDIYSIRQFSTLRTGLVKKDLSYNLTPQTLHRSL